MASFDVARTVDSGLPIVCAGVRDIRKLRRSSSCSAVGKVYGRIRAAKEYLDTHVEPVGVCKNNVARLAPLKIKSTAKVVPETTKRMAPEASKRNRSQNKSQSMNEHQAAITPTGKFCFRPSVGTWLSGRRQPPSAATAVLEKAAPQVDVGGVSFVHRPSVGTWLAPARTKQQVPASLHGHLMPPQGVGQGGLLPATAPALLADSRQQLQQNWTQDDAEVEARETLNEAFFLQQAQDEMEKYACWSQEEAEVKAREAVIEAFFFQQAQDEVEKHPCWTQEEAEVKAREAVNEAFFLHQAQEEAKKPPCWTLEEAEVKAREALNEAFFLQQAQEEAETHPCWTQEDAELKAREAVNEAFFLQQAQEEAEKRRSWTQEEAEVYARKALNEAFFAQQAHEVLRAKPSLRRFSHLPSVGTWLAPPRFQ